MELHTHHLLLREFVSADWPAVLAYQRDSQYLRFYHWIDRTPEDVQRFVQMFLDQQREQPRLKFQLAVILKSSGQLIGNCGIRRDTIDASQADIGYELDPNYWGYGYATEAARAITAFGFTQLNVHRIWAWCIADNTASARVLERVGLRLEGRLRETDHFKGRWWDRLVYALLEDEWRVQTSYQSV